MKELINKCIQTITAILISSIVVYGVYAQKVCCKTIIDACIPASDRISSGYTTGSRWTTFQSQRRNIQLQSNLCSKNILADFGAGNTCCQTDRCDGDNLSTEFSLSFIHDFNPLQKIASSFDAGNSAEKR